MIIVALLGLVTFFEVALGLLIWRADPKRWENRIFTLLSLADALTNATRLERLSEGLPLAAIDSLRWCIVGTVLTTFFSLGFAASFPFNQRPPKRFTALGALASITILTLTLIDYPRFAPWTTMYFFPAFIVMLMLLARNYRRLKSAPAPVIAELGCGGVKLVMAAIVWRWAVSMFVWQVVRNVWPQSFETGLYFESTAGVLIGEVIFGYAILRNHLFRVRGVMTEAVLYASIGLALIGLVVLEVDAVLRSNVSQAVARTLLIAIALAPMALGATVQQIMPRLEATLFDPRRSSLKETLDGVIGAMSREVEPQSMLEIARQAIVRVAPGAELRFLVTASFPSSGAASTGARPPPALAAELLRREEPFLHRLNALVLAPEILAELGAMPGDLLVPVRRGGTLYGVWTLAGQDLDRDLALTLVGLSQHLALRLENSALFVRKLELEKELEGTRRLASLGSFAAAIAHDIRTPLTSVQMNVQILRSKSRLEPDDMEHFDIALEELRRLNAHISEILDFAKPVQLHPASVDVREVADEAAKSLELILAGRNLRLERRHGGELPPVLADPIRIRQVLLNLLDNAAQACTDGAAIVLSTRAEEAQVAVEVSDPGRGIAPENLAKIFEPFFTTRADGTGLGLAIAQKLIRAHGGEIRVRSSVGQGSTFTILLPRAA
jgi:signal transduction histidine kinase